MSAPSDADTLRRAAHIVRRRSRKPNGLAMRVLIRLLLSVADDIDPPPRDLGLVSDASLNAQNARNVRSLP